MLERLVKRGKKSGRVDDNPETAKNRINVSVLMTLIKYWKTSALG